LSNPKRQIFEQIAELARTIGHAHRLDLLEHLGQGERSVEALAQRVGLSVANTSQHLQHLRRLRLAETRRDGKRIMYRLGDGPILEVLGALRNLAERNLAGVQVVLDAYFNRLDAFEPVSRKELKRRLRAGGVTLLDVRQEDEYALGHLPGALNIPLADLESRLADLPKDQEIVAYCRGAYCVLSFEAVAFLRAKGYRVRRLEDGFPEWKAAGHNIEAA